MSTFLRLKSASSARSDGSKVSKVTDKEAELQREQDAQEAADVEAEDRKMDTELYSKRMQTVNGEIEGVRKQEMAEAVIRQEALAHAERHSRFLDAGKEDAYVVAVENAVLARNYTQVTGQTHGSFAQLLPNLAEGVKKSAQRARNETTSEAAEGERKEVHSLQTRSFHSGGAVYFVKAYAPRLFCRIRNHLGLSYEAFSRCLEQDQGGYLESGDHYFTTRSHLAFRKIQTDEMHLILGVLEAYSAHISANPYTLLPHWYGIFYIKTAGVGSYHFLVTNNVLHTVDSIDALYDIKGSTVRHSSKKARGGKQFVLPKKIDPETMQPVQLMFNDEHLITLTRTVGSPLVMHPEERLALLKTVRLDTLFLAEQDIYNYGLLIAMHNASADDDLDAVAHEDGFHSRWGGHSRIEDRYHITFVGPFQRWDIKARAAFGWHTVMDGVNASVVPPVRYATRLRETTFDIFLEFGENLDYATFQERREPLMDAMLRRLQPESEASSDVGGGVPGAHLQDGQTKDRSEKAKERRKRERQRALLKLGDAKAGIGVVIGTRKEVSKGGRVLISKLLPDRPAIKSGKVQVGDLLVGVGRLEMGIEWVWRDVSAMSAEKVKPLLVGEEDEYIGLQLMRADEVGHLVSSQVVLQFAIDPEVAARAELAVRSEAERAQCMQEMAELCLQRLQHQTECTAEGHPVTANMLVDELTSCDEAEDILEYAEVGGYVIYRSPDLPNPPWGFAGLCCSFKSTPTQVEHNLLYMVHRPLHLVSPDDPWLPYDQWLSVHLSPWALHPSWLADNCELFPSFVHLVGALPPLRKYVHPDAPPSRPPTVRERTPTPPPTPPPEPMKTLYDLWAEERKGLGALAGEKQMLLRDLESGAPLHARAAWLRLEERTHINLSGADIGRMVAPAAAMQHLSTYYPEEMDAVTAKLDGNEEGPEHDDGKVHEGQVWTLVDGQSGQQKNDWRQRRLVMRGAALHVQLDKKRGGALKKMCDLRSTVECRSLMIGKFKHCISITYDYDEGSEATMVFAVEDNTEVVGWLEAMAEYSLYIAREQARITKQA